MNAPRDPFAHLAALKPRRTRTSSAARPSGDALPAEADTLAELVGGAVERNHYGAHLIVRCWFPAPEPAAALDALRLLAPGLPASAADPARWLFLDTETTGLAGGTGTYAFLVGLAWFDSAGLAVEQLFMRDYTEEHALLVALAAHLRRRPVLVTFNGKTFDWPLLETRFRMTRQIEVPEPAAHLDLLHPARQLWRLKLGSVRLSELERHVAGFDRGADLWSQMIPQIYFDYLRGGPASPLVDVFRHNQMDLRGMAEVVARMLRLVAEPDAADGDALELFGLSRLVGRRGEAARARELYERALAAGLPEALGRAARRELARLAKRDRDYARANALWKELLGGASDGVDGAGANFSSPDAASRRNGGELKFGPTARARENGMGDELEAYEQLAIYYEHRVRDPRRAAALTREALAAVEAAARAGRLAPSRYRTLHARLSHRLARLRRHSPALL